MADERGAVLALVALDEASAAGEELLHESFGDAVVNESFTKVSVFHGGLDLEWRMSRTL